MACECVKKNKTGNFSGKQTDKSIKDGTNLPAIVNGKTAASFKDFYSSAQNNKNKNNKLKKYHRQ